ncbi:MAG: PIG-L family deacetylase, partial [Lachnospira sp.]|nr:PIG-L family deacetylase [Lachnospira sp.]
MTRDISSRLTSSLIKTVMTLLSVFALVILFNESPVSAEQLDIMINTPGNGSSLTDGSYSTTVEYSMGDSIIISSDTPIDSLYIIWDSPVSQWTLDTGSQNLICGTNGFLHEYIKLPGITENISINIHDTCRISDIYAFSDGDVPDYVQIWEKPCDAADFLVFSTHADDEILFLGGVLATYGGEESLPVQVCYLTNYWNGLRIREHEKLDGLWECGIRNYPVNGDFDDLYSETLQQAESVYVYD